MTPTPNPTAEQILAAELMKLWDTPAGTEPVWMPEVKAIARVLRAHGLLFEGAPSEEQIERDAVIQQMQDELEYRVRTSVGKARLNYDKAFIDDQVQEGRARIGKLAFTAAGVRGDAKLLQNSGPSEEQIETVKRVVRETAHIRPYAVTDDPHIVEQIVTEAVRAALTAAGVAPQGPLPVASVLPVGDDSGRAGDDDRGSREKGPEGEGCGHELTVAGVVLDPEKVADHMESYYDRWSGPGEESPTFRDYADALCEAAKRGELT